MNKIKYGLVTAGATIVGLFSTLVAKADTLSTTTLGTSIDTMSQSWYDYFLVFIAHAWPFILGASVLLGIVGLAIYLVHKLFGKR